MSFPPNPYNDYAWIIGNPEIYAGTWIGPFTIIDGSGGLHIGKECDISSGVHIYTHSTVKRCVNAQKYLPDGSINKDAIERKPVYIGDHTFIGANATILPGVTIGDYCVVAAGSVVTKDVSDYCVVGGVPAIKIGKTR